MKKRVIYSNNAVLTDFTENLNNFYSGETTITVVAAEDSILIGSSLPFNHIYIKLGSTVNANTSALSLKLWDGLAFEDVAELIDGTESGGATLAQSGFIEFVPDRNEAWNIDDTVDTNDNETVTGLGALTIYDKYWLKLSVSADLTADLNIAWIGQKFATDNDLGAEFPDLNRASVLSAVTGNADWEEQHIKVAKIIIKDLKRKKVITHKNQILVRDDLTLPSVSKLAEMIYGMLGDDYNDDRLKVQKEYIYRLSTAFPVVDLNRNARVDRNENIPQHGRLIR